MFLLPLANGKEKALGKQIKTAPAEKNYFFIGKDPDLVFSSKYFMGTGLSFYQSSDYPFNDRKEHRA